MVKDVILESEMRGHFPPSAHCEIKQTHRPVAGPELAGLTG